MSVSLIIAAGGKSARFFNKASNEELKLSSPKSKLFFSLGDESILSKTIEAFNGLEEISEIMVMVPKDLVKHVKEEFRICQSKKVAIYSGGSSRSETVYLGLKKCRRKSTWIMVHDGARPFVTAKAIAGVIGSVKGCDGVILAAKVVPTIKQSEDGLVIERTLDRNSLFEAQTPQLMKRQHLMAAYRSRKKGFSATDESLLLESSGRKVKIFTHDEWNPKLTSWKDWQIAEALLRRTAVYEKRTGMGKDIHRLVPGRKFYLGGIIIPFYRGPEGHSDGDVLLHALVDACLGALALGDTRTLTHDARRAALWAGERMQPQLVHDAM